MLYGKSEVCCFCVNKFNKKLYVDLCICIPLKLSVYVNQDILMNRSIKDALIAEEKFFRSRPVWH